MLLELLREPESLYLYFLVLLVPLPTEDGSEDFRFVRYLGVSYFLVLVVFLSTLVAPLLVTFVFSTVLDVDLIPEDLFGLAEGAVLVTFVDVLVFVTLLCGPLTTLVDPVLLDP